MNKDYKDNTEENIIAEPETTEEIQQPEELAENAPLEEPIAESEEPTVEPEESTTTPEPEAADEAQQPEEPAEKAPAEEPVAEPEEPTVEPEESTTTPEPEAAEEAQQPEEPAENAPAEEPVAEPEEPTATTEPETNEEAQQPEEPAENTPAEGLVAAAVALDATDEADAENSEESDTADTDAEKSEDEKQEETQNAGTFAAKMAVMTKAVKDKLSHLERKHYYWIAGIGALLIAGIIALIVSSKNNDDESQLEDEDTVFAEGNKNDVVEEPEQGFGINDDDSVKNDSSENKPLTPTTPSTSSSRSYPRTSTPSRSSAPSRRYNPSRTSTPTPSTNPSTSRTSNQGPGPVRDVPKPQKRALLIGLGEQMDSNWPKIYGDADVDSVKLILEKCGYQDENIKTLVNASATRLNIMNAFESLKNQCNLGDVVYIHFAGYGQCVQDKNKENTYYESWIPYDAYKTRCDRDDGKKHLIEYEVDSMLKNIADVIGEEGKMVVVVDTYNSVNTQENNKYNSAPFVSNVELKPQTTEKKWITLNAGKLGQLKEGITLKEEEQKMGRLTYVFYSIFNKDGLMTITKFNDYIKQNYIDPQQANNPNSLRRTFSMPLLNKPDSIPQNPVVLTNDMEGDYTEFFDLFFNKPIEE